MRITDSLFPYSFQINAAVVAENYVRNQSDYDCPACVSLSIRDYGYDGDVEVGSAILSTKAVNQGIVDQNVVAAGCSPGSVAFGGGTGALRSTRNPKSVRTSRPWPLQSVGCSRWVPVVVACDTPQP